MAKEKPSFFLIVFSTSILLLFCEGLSSFAADGVRSERMEILYADGVRIVYEPGGSAVAEEMAVIYSEIKAKTENLFGWAFRKRATVVMIRDRKRFLTLANNPITVAYAVPEQNTIVIDYSTAGSNPFSLETTLMHEFCHLLLHDKLPRIPRWLDEGLCQWASGGLDEIIYSQEQARSKLNQAAVSNSFLPFENLEAAFPPEEGARLLAYEQSRSFVTYLARKFGPEKLRSVLREMKDGETLETASFQIYGVSFERLEKDWRESVRTEWTWLAFIANHIYTFLFVAGAIVTLFGFLRFLRKKKNYRDEYWDDNKDTDKTKYDFNDYYDYYDDDFDEYDD